MCGKVLRGFSIQILLFNIYSRHLLKQRVETVSFYELFFEKFTLKTRKENIEIQHREKNRFLIVGRVSVVVLSLVLKSLTNHRKFVLFQVLFYGFQPAVPSVIPYSNLETICTGDMEYFPSCPLLPLGLHLGQQGKVCHFTFYNLLIQNKYVPLQEFLYTKYDF